MTCIVMSMIYHFLLLASTYNAHQFDCSISFVPEICTNDFLNNKDCGFYHCNDLFFTCKNMLNPTFLFFSEADVLKIIEYWLRTQKLIIRSTQSKTRSPLVKQPHNIIKLCMYIAICVKSNNRLKIVYSRICFQSQNPA